MSFQICIKTEKPLQQLASELASILSLPPYQHETFGNETYYQFELLGMLLLVHCADEEGQDPEVIHYPYCLDLQMTFTDCELDTDEVEYAMQPYYAQLLSFKLEVDTAHHERQKVDSRWQIRYRFYKRNPQWTGSILYGEPGWKPAVIDAHTSNWRFIQPVL